MTEEERNRAAQPWPEPEEYSTLDWQAWSRHSR